MRKIFLLFIFICQLFATSNFETKQEKIAKVKKQIQKEELIARAYEDYILHKKFGDREGTNMPYYEKPKNINDLASYLPANTLSNTDTNMFKNFKLGTSQSPLALEYSLKDNTFQDIYKSNTYRRRTFVNKRQGTVFIKLKDPFAKNLLYLLNNTIKGDICQCDEQNRLRWEGIRNVYCFKNNIFYIYSKTSSRLFKKLLINYHKDRFTTGPIIINKDYFTNSTYQAREEFAHLPEGVIIYDTDGIPRMNINGTIQEVQK